MPYAYLEWHWLEQVLISCVHEFLNGNFTYKTQSNSLLTIKCTIWLNLRCIQRIKCYNCRYCGREVFWDCLAWRGPLMTPLPGNYLICPHPPPNPIKHENRPSVLTEFFNILELFGRWNKLCFRPLTTWQFCHICLITDLSPSYCAP